MAQKVCWRTVVVCLVLGLGTIALYSPALGFGFIGGDELYVTGNPYLNHVAGAHGISWIFQAGYAGNWHPLTWLSHIIDRHLFGLKAGGHHATSLVLHALNSVLLFLVLRRMTGAFWRSAAVAAFFAWHPLHVESVAWIAERKDVLSGFFCMLTLWAYVRYTEGSKSQNSNFKLFYALALGCFALGLMAKPMLVTLPFILLLIDWWPLARLTPVTPTEGAATPPQPPASAVSLLIEKIPFFILAIGSCIATVIAEHRQELAAAGSRLPLKMRIVTVGVTYFRYLKETVWPSDLGTSYPYMFHRPKSELAVIALILVGLSILAIRFRKTRPYWLTGWLWFVGMIVPTLSLIFSATEPMADRYMYLPSIGLFILICWDATDLASQWPSGKIILGCLCGAALAGCLVASSLQLQSWRNERTLLSRIPEPELNFMAHGNYASFLMRHNDLPTAQAECEKAIKIMPTYAPLQAELGEILLQQGKIAGAIEKFAYVLKLDPRMVGVHLPWGRAYLAEKQIDAAEQEFKIVVNAEPKNFEAHNYLGEAYQLSGNIGAAAKEYEQSLTAQANQPETLNNLAWIFATDPHPEIRNGTNAIKLATYACNISRGTQPVFIGTLAAAYAETGHFDEAVTMAQKAHDLATADSAAAQKAKELNAARTLQSLADRELQLVQLFKSHQPFRDKPGK